MDLTSYYLSVMSEAAKLDLLNFIKNNQGDLNCIECAVESLNFVGLFVTDVNGVILYANDVLKLYGYDFKDVFMKSGFDIIIPTHRRKKVIKKFKRVCKTGIPVTELIQHIDKAGNTLNLRSTVLKLPATNLLMVTIREVTQQVSNSHPAEATRHRG